MLENDKCKNNFIYILFFFPTFWTGLLQIKVQVIAQCLRFVIFHPWSPEHDGTNMKRCQLLYGHCLDLWKCAQCFPSVKSQKKPPWGTMWCCLLWPRITKMKGLSEHRLFKTIQVFFTCTCEEGNVVFTGALWALACVFVSVFVCPDRVSQMKLILVVLAQLLKVGKQRAHLTKYTNWAFWWKCQGGTLLPASPDCQVKSSGLHLGKVLGAFGGAAVQSQRASDENKNAVELLLLLALR